jgi:hypothetical protein
LPQLRWARRDSPVVLTRERERGTIWSRSTLGGKAMMERLLPVVLVPFLGLQAGAVEVERGALSELPGRMGVFNRGSESNPATTVPEYGWKAEVQVWVELWMPTGGNGRATYRIDNRTFQVVISVGAPGQSNVVAESRSIGAVVIAVGGSGGGAAVARAPNGGCGFAFGGEGTTGPDGISVPVGTGGPGGPGGAGGDADVEGVLRLSEQRNVSGFAVSGKGGGGGKGGNGETGGSGGDGGRSGKSTVTLDWNGLRDGWHVDVGCNARAESLSGGAGGGGGNGSCFLSAGGMGGTGGTTEYARATGFQAVARTREAGRGGDGGSGGVAPCQRTSGGYGGKGGWVMPAFAWGGSGAFFNPTVGIMTSYAAAYGAKGGRGGNGGNGTEKGGNGGDGGKGGDAAVSSRSESHQPKAGDPGDGGDPGIPLGAPGRPGTSGSEYEL